MIQTKSHKFLDIFTWKDEETQVNGIVIPIVQRDYAQGRQNDKVNRIRNNFLEVLYKALAEGEKTTLDFIYGNIENGKLIPLDGQQRLTTLFLLHYYIARHENIPEDEWKFLYGFSYETRTSSREFCYDLLGFSPDFSKESTLSLQIKDEAWFLMEWESDPTVKSMLVMLDAINEIFAKTNNIWERLLGDYVTFYFLPLKDMGVTDELYIKMNSRGKPLTPFEHFKAELELRMKEVEGIEDVQVKGIIRKMDCEWSDMLWPFRNSATGDTQADMVTDDEFLRYIHFISDLIGYQRGESEEIGNEFDIIDKRFSKNCTQALANIRRMESLFDIWTKEKNLDEFFNRFITKERHEDGKILMELPSDWTVNLFKECCKRYGLRQGKRPMFPLGQFILLYAFILYLEERYRENDLSQQDNLDDIFCRRLRVLNNLVKNSSDTLRSENMQGLLEQTEKIILYGSIEQVEEGKARYQTEQVKEEIKKIAWTAANPEKAAILYQLEDHPYLNGYIKAVGLEHVDWFDRFDSLFKCDLNLVNNALLSIGDYFEKDAWRYQIGTSNSRLALGVWRSLFSPVRLQDNLCCVLQRLLSGHEIFTNEVLEQIITNYLETAHEMPVTYYLVKYPEMQKSRWGGECRFGKYYWRNHWELKEERSTYNVLMMTTEVSLGGMNYDIFLKALFERAGGTAAGLELGDYSYSQYNGGGLDKLHLTEKSLYLTLSDNRYTVCEENGDIEIESYDIKQENGVDIEDRVEIGLGIIDRIMKSTSLEAFGS